MRVRIAAAGLLTLLLAGCGGTGPSPAPGPTPTAPAPTPTVEPGGLVDDTHDAFYVETGGAMGRLLVTVELGAEEETLTFSVWRDGDREGPIQTWTAEYMGVFHWSEVVDANFDGYQDFGYMYSMGNQPTYWHFWLWDEEQGRFTAEPAFDTISAPTFDGQAETVSGYARSSAASAVQTYYRWEGGRLVCVRRIEFHYPEEVDGGVTQLLTVEDRVDGALTEVFRKTSGPQEYFDLFEEAACWNDLDYHGAESGTK